MFQLFLLLTQQTSCFGVGRAGTIAAIDLFSSDVRAISHGGVSQCRDKRRLFWILLRKRSPPVVNFSKQQTHIRESGLRAAGCLLACSMTRLLWAMALAVSGPIDSVSPRKPAGSVPAAGRKSLASSCYVAKPDIEPCPQLPSESLAGAMGQEFAGGVCCWSFCGIDVPFASALL